MAHNGGDISKETWQSNSGLYNTNGIFDMNLTGTKENLH